MRKRVGIYKSILDHAVLFAERRVPGSAAEGSANGVDRGIEEINTGIGVVHKLHIVHCDRGAVPRLIGIGYDRRYRRDKTGGSATCSSPAVTAGTCSAAGAAAGRAVMDVDDAVIGADKRIGAVQLPFDKNGVVMRLVHNGAVAAHGISERQCGIRRIDPCQLRLKQLGIIKRSVTEMRGILLIIRQGGKPRGPCHTDRHDVGKRFALLRRILKVIDKTVGYRAAFARQRDAARVRIVGKLHSDTVRQVVVEFHAGIGGAVPLYVRHRLSADGAGAAHFDLISARRERRDRSDEGCRP